METKIEEKRELNIGTVKREGCFGKCPFSEKVPELVKIRNKHFEFKGWLK